MFYAFRLIENNTIIRKIFPLWQSGCQNNTDQTIRWVLPKLVDTAVIFKQTKRFIICQTRKTRHVVAVLKAILNDICLASQPVAACRM